MEQGGGVTEKPQDKIQDLHRQIDEVIEKMNENVNGMINREDKLEGLFCISEEMREEAQHFKQTSQKVARSYWWKNIKLIVVIVVVVLIIVLIIILLATGVIPVSAPVPPIVTPTKAP